MMTPGSRHTTAKSTQRLLLARRVTFLVIIKMRCGNRPVWGQGCWKLNNELLKQDKFKDEVQQIIQVYRANKGYFDPNTGWDVLKLNIKKMAIRYAIGSKKQERNLLKDLDNRLHEAKKDLDNSLNMETNVQIIKETELQIKEIKDRKQEGERIRVKQEKILYDERSTKYFSTWKREEVKINRSLYSRKIMKIR